MLINDLRHNAERFLSASPGIFKSAFRVSVAKVIARAHSSLKTVNMISTSYSQTGEVIDDEHRRCFVEGEV